MRQERSGYIVVEKCITIVLSYDSDIIDPGGWQL